MKKTVSDEFDECGRVNIDYDMPDIDLQTLLKSDKKHISLPKCTSSPTNAYNLLNGEEAAFPYLFPFGLNGYKHERAKMLYASDYFHHRLFYKDGRFRKDIGYLLHAVNFFEYQRLLNSVNIHMRMRKSANSPLTVKDIKEVNPNSEIINNSFMFMKNIRGTAAYWKNNLINLLSMFKTLGPPSIFCYFNSK